MSDNKKLVEETASQDFVGLVSNFILHFMFYKEQNLIRDFENDHEKLTDYFILDNALDIGKVIDEEEIRMLRDFNIEEIAPALGDDPRFKKLLKNAFTHFSKSLHNLTEKENRFELKRPVEFTLNVENITSDLEYVRNNPSDYTKSPSISTLALY